jgi:hypothetical protein
MKFRAHNRDTGSLKVASLDVRVGDAVEIVGEGAPRTVTYVMGRPERGTLHVVCRGTGPMPLGDVEFEVIRRGEAAEELRPPEAKADLPRARTISAAGQPPPRIRRSGGTLFDAYLMVDWSARSSSTGGTPIPDAVWVSEAVWEGEELKWDRERYFPTRRACIEFLIARLSQHISAARKVLVGFDFPFGYPAGLARALGFEGPSWREIWKLLRDPRSFLVDVPENQYADADNANNRFALAGAINRAASEGDRFIPGPFHGCPERHESIWLVRARPEFPFAVRSGVTLEYWRHTDSRLRDQGWRPLSAWWVLGGGAPTVGGQALVGIPAVHEIAERLGGSATIWPFETGFTSKPMGDGVNGRVVFAEIWPGLLNGSLQPGLIRDQAQVRATTGWAASADASRSLRLHFDAPAGLLPSEVEACADEEGWILGV